MTSAPSTFLVDTNVLVYGEDVRDAKKQQKAIDLLAALSEAQTGAVSVQILGEFFNATTRRIKPPLSREAAANAVERLAEALPVFDLRGAMVYDALRGVTQHNLSYYDGLIWATARFYGVPFVLSEDMNSGQVIEGVRIINPFAPDFDLAVLS